MRAWLLAAALMSVSFACAAPNTVAYAGAPGNPLLAERFPYRAASPGFEIQSEQRIPLEPLLVVAETTLGRQTDRWYWSFTRCPMETPSNRPRAGG
jgi:hypothetical protein